MALDRCGSPLSRANMVFLPQWFTDHWLGTERTPFRAHYCPVFRGLLQEAGDLTKRSNASLGGHIERLVGTLMGDIHLLPGTTFSSVADRGDYNSEAKAVLTCRNWSNG
jgi:hypothetical protein